MARLTKKQQKQLDAFRETLPEYRRHERYFFVNDVWDVVHGLWLISQWPADYQEHRMEAVPVHALCEANGITKEPSRKLFSRHVNREMSLELCQETPILLGLWRFDETEAPVALLLDGAHRLYKALVHDVPEIGAYILSETEMRAIKF